jgi:uncharacterized protein (TIGR02246 family)
MRGSRCILTLTLVLTVPCAVAAQDVTGDEAAIRALNVQWLALIKNHDATATANLYASDGAIMPPGQPGAQGHEAIAAVWKKFFEVPGFSLTFQADKITISAARDMAIDMGTYVLETGEGPAEKTDHGKYVVAWVKRDGQWKVANDIFNSNGP